MIEVSETVAKHDVFSRISAEILQDSTKLSRGKKIVLAGNIVYEELLGENESQVLKGGDIEFRRAEKLPDLDAVIVNLDTFNAVKLESFNL